jgi:hypothetical protein
MFPWVSRFGIIGKTDRGVDMRLIADRRGGMANLKVILLLILAWVPIQTNAYAFSSKDLERLKTTNQCPACDLREANLQNANLADANLEGANLSKADLSGANLQGANLTRASLKRANLKKANLSGTILVWTNLVNANLADTVLRRALLRGANLVGANLTNADLEISFYDSNTTFEPGFNPESRGMKQFPAPK